MENNKKKYIKPEIELIRLDNEISLVLDSTPMIGPGEGTMNAPIDMNENPYNDNVE